MGAAGAVVPRIGDDADDLCPGSGLALPAEARAGTDRVPATEVSRDKRLVDDDQTRSTGTVGFVEHPPSQQRDPHRVEIAARGHRREGARQRCTRSGAFHFDLPREEVGRRELRHHPGLRHARHRLDAPRQLLEERRHRLAGRVLLLRQRQAHRQDTLRIEPGIRRLHLQKTAHQQSGAEQQHDRKRDLGDDEALPEPGCRPRLAAAAVRLEGLVWIGSRRVQRWQHRHQHAGQQPIAALHASTRPLTDASGSCSRTSSG